MSPTPTPPQMQLSHMPVSGVKPGQRVEAVVHAVDRAVRGVGRERRPGRPGRGAEAQFLSFQVAQRLIDGQAGNGRQQRPSARRSQLVGIRNRRTSARHARSSRDSAASCRSRPPRRSVAAESTSITPKITAACRIVLEHPAEHDQRGDRHQDDAQAGQDVGPVVGILERMRAVGAEEAAAVGAELLDGDDRRDRATGNLLRLGGAVVVGPHRARLRRSRPWRSPRASSARRRRSAARRRRRHSGTKT